MSAGPQFRVGQGWDVHRIATGRKLILGGLEIPSEFGLEGHSDADVLAHAITDAILGAVALGDIGMHFPDTDPRWKGADSLVFLRHVFELAREAGYRIVNVDSTLILSHPKIAPHASAIREHLSKLLGIAGESIGIKAKTPEGMGTENAAIAHAVVLLGKAPSPRKSKIL